MTRAIYFTAKDAPDLAIFRGLRAAGCEVTQTHCIADTLAQLSPDVGESTVLVADLQAGAIPLLTMLVEQGRSAAPIWPFGDPLAIPIPPTMIVDRDGSNISAVIRALQLGVRDYVLLNSRDAEREVAARLLVERNQCAQSLAETAMLLSTKGHIPATHGTARAIVPRPQFVWIAQENVVRCPDGDVLVSHTEGRIFEQLARCQGRVVSVRELLAEALKCAEVDPICAVARLRTHMMRLRQKLQSHTAMANRIVNVRGSGYMLV